jgi:hypothetical protein
VKEMCALLAEQFLRISPSTVQQRELYHQFRPDVPDMEDWPAQPRPGSLPAGWAAL